MWPRIYFGVLAAAILAVGFFTYYSWSWLESIGRPQDAVAGYQATSGLAWTLLCITSIVLLFMAAAVMWTRERAWALWVTFAYFAVFLAIEGFYLDHEYQQLLEQSTGVDAKLWATPLINVLTIIGAAVVTIGLQYLIVTVHRRFYPETAAVDLDAENESSRLM
jgi:hypothetical protein